MATPACLFPEIVNSSQPEKILIYDDALNNGLDLLSSLIIHRASATRAHVHLLCFDKRPEFWTKRLAALAERVTLHDFWKDAFGWISSDKTMTSSTIMAQFSSAAKPAISSAAQHQLIVFDGTSALMTLHPNAFCALLEKMSLSQGSASAVSFVILHHTDLFDDHSEKTLRGVSTSNVAIKSVGRSRRNELEYTCIVNHLPRRKTHINRVEQVVIGSGWTYRASPVDSTKRVHSTPQNSTIENMTFNLNLTDEELSARNRVQLPHVQGGGVIYYEPDEADDIDYEEPDE